MAREGLSEMTPEEPGLRGKNVLSRVNSKNKGTEGGRYVPVPCVRDGEEQKVAAEQRRTGR